MFRTAATLVPEDHNLDPAHQLTGEDWYLKDMQTGAFELLTLDPSGVQLAPGGSKRLDTAGYVSASGRYVAFQLEVEVSSTYSSDIYVRDRQTGVTRRVSGGVEVLSGLSGDGLHVGIDEFSTCTLCQPPFPGEAIVNWAIGTRYEIPCEAGGRMGLSDDGRFAAVVQTAEQTSCTVGVAPVQPVFRHASGDDHAHGFREPERGGRTSPVSRCPPTGSGSRTARHCG